MKRILIPVSIVAALVGGLLALNSRALAARSHASPMSIQILSPAGPVAVGHNGTIPLTMRVTGMTFDPAHVGKAARPGFGHGHFYVDCIPGDAYATADIKSCWAGAFTSPTAAFSLKSSAVKVTKGTHLLIVALSQNDHVLYRAPAATIVFTVR